MNVKISDGGFLPVKAHTLDAGYDLKTPEDFTLTAGGSIVIDTRVSLEIPAGYFGKLESKSGLNVNHNIQVTGGVIDSGYRGSIKLRLTNSGKHPYIFQRGDKIAQIVFIPVGLFDLNEVTELGKSLDGRENSGFGSSGR